MIHRYINENVIRSFNQDAFFNAEPFPWHNFDQFIMPSGFRELTEKFPPPAQFEKHQGLVRGHGQRPHDRYYLAYERSIYGRSGRLHDRGVVAHRDLAKPWQSFLDELRTSRTYADFIRSLLQVSRFKMRFAWHRGISGSEVSPHRDSSEKIGTHIFYFNTNSDWNIAWGGSTLVLGGKTIDKMNPDFSDFISITTVQFLDNRSFLFKNTRDAWHGVEPLQPPDGQHRCLFNVIFEYPSLQYKVGRLMRKVSRLVDKEQLRRS